MENPHFSLKLSLSPDSPPHGSLQEQLKGVVSPEQQKEQPRRKRRRASTPDP